MSKTGGGKTAVYGVSMLQLIDPAAPGPQGMILTPTRELAVQADGDKLRNALPIGHMVRDIRQNPRANSLLLPPRDSARHVNKIID